MDVGAVAVRALAPVLRVILRAFTGESDDTAAIRRQAATPPDDVVTAADALLARTVAWFLLMVLHLPAVMLAGLIAGGPDRLPGWVSVAFGISGGICGLTGILTSIRFGAAYRAMQRDEDGWPARRRLLTPGNRDVIVATVVVTLIGLVVAFGS